MLYPLPMEQVWLTRAGSRYHAKCSCPALADGHAKAASEGRPNYAAQLIPLNHVPPGVSPCSRCWPTRSEWDQWKQLEHQTIRSGDSNFEYEFLHRVLKHVNGLEPYCVRVQHEVTGSAGRNYRVDFAILPPGGKRIAIEIDGFNKTTAGNVATSEHQDRDSTRRSELAIAGWHVLSFTNRQVQTQSGECRRQIENALLADPTPHPNPAATVPTALAGPPKPTYIPPPAASSSPANQNSTGRILGWVVGLAAVAVAALWILNNTLGGTSSGSDSTSPNGGDCPSGYSVKGNVNDTGEKIYHEPGWRYYDSTWPEECFTDAAAAQNAGYRESEIH